MLLQFLDTVMDLALAQVFGTHVLRLHHDMVLSSNKSLLGRHRRLYLSSCFSRVRDMVQAMPFI